MSTHNVDPQTYPLAHKTLNTQNNKSFSYDRKPYGLSTVHISYLANVHFNMYTCHFLPALFVLLAMAIYTGVTVNFLGKRFGDWRFSWSYILGWVDRKSVV